MICPVCETAVRFSSKDELFFHTPEGKTPCDECKAKFDKIRNWSNNLQADITVQVAIELANKIELLNQVINSLKNTKRHKKGWFSFK